MKCESNRPVRGVSALDAVHHGFNVRHEKRRIAFADEEDLVGILGVGQEVAAVLGHVVQLHWPRQLRVEIEEPEIQQIRFLS